MDNQQNTERLCQTLSMKAEQDILARVGPLVIESYLQENQRSTPLILPAWLWGSAMTAVAAVTIFLWNPGQSSVESSFVTQNVRSVSSKQTPSQTKLLFQASQKKPGTLRMANIWKIRTKGRTTLALTKPSGTSQGVYLKKGLIQVRVKPKSMKRFSVFVQSYQVKVIGTVFSVQRESSWLRVEVKRGKVKLISPRQPSHTIVKGRGCRIDLKTKTKNCYTLPPSAKRQPKQRLLWLSQHHPQQLYAYTQDLITRFDLPLKQRILLTQIAAKELQRTKQNQAALRSYLALTKLKHNEDQDQVLLNSAFLCQAHQEKSVHLCRAIFRICLKRCQLPVWREQSHAMLSKLMSVEAKTPTQHKKAVQFIHQYLKLYQNGTWEKDVRQYLIRHIISLEHRQGCKKARSYLMKGSKGEPWFQKYCPQ